MPVHDWTKVKAGIFHDFHTAWIAEIRRDMNAGLLPDGYYAMAEQIAGGFGPDILTLGLPTNRDDRDVAAGGTATMELPKTQVRQRTAGNPEPGKRKSITIRHIGNHRIVAVIELVSPGNKSTRHGVRAFIAKLKELIDARVHVAFVDLFPPGPRNPDGLHALLWEHYDDEPFRLVAEAPLAQVSYRATYAPEAFLEPFAVGGTMIEWPVFLNPHEFVLLPLESTYMAAWATMPAYWKHAIVNGLEQQGDDDADLGQPL